MKLTGKAKKDFEEWYLEQDYCILSLTEYSEEMVIKMFKALANPFRYGVYVDWFFSVGIEVSINPVSYNISYSKDENPAYAFYPKRDFNNTRTVTIKKANEIYNNKRHENTN